MDARWEQPTVGMTLTTHRPNFDMQRFRRGVFDVTRWLRSTYGREVEYLGLMEWTTGRSGKGRMPHQHMLVKGLDPDACDDVWAALKPRWERITGGAYRIDCRPLRSPGGAVAYMVGHHHKREQAPPSGWSGKRIRPSKGYFSRRPLEAAGASGSAVEHFRQLAREQLQRKRAERALLAKLIDSDVPPDVIDDLLNDLWAYGPESSRVELVRIDQVDGHTEVAVRSRKSDSALRWRSWLTVGAPYA